MSAADKKNDDASGPPTGPTSTDDASTAVAGGAMAKNTQMASRRGGPQKRYTDELGDHWQKQFTQNAADPNATAYTAHSSGFSDGAEVAPPPIDAAPPVGAFESQLPAHQQVATQPAEPTLVAPPAAVQGAGGAAAPALFTPPVASPGAASPGGGTGGSVSRYPEGGGIQSGGLSYEPPPPAPSWDAGQSGFGGQQSGFGGAAAGFDGAGGGESSGDDPRWNEADAADSGAPTGPPIEVCKKEILMLLNAVKARIQVDQNAQIAAGGSCLLALILLFFLGIWLLVLALLAVFGGVGYRVHVLTKQPARAAPGAFTKDF
jgi:hypothetical protein